MVDFNRNTYTANATTASGLNVIAGIWLIISPFVVGFSDLFNPMWNNIIVGIAVLILAGIRAADPARNVVLSWINFLLGIWLIISPFAFQVSASPRILWNNIILGIIVGLLGMWSALSVPRMTATSTRPTV